MGKSTRAGERRTFALSATKRLSSGRFAGGFTLAGVLVLVTIVMIFVAYTVPKQWSTIMQRQRELQTIYVMRQYARGCLEFQRKHTVWPSSIDQLKDARLPRFIRAGPKGEIVDPLTGEVDWLVVPAAAGQPANGTAAGNAGSGTFGVGVGTPGPGAGGTNSAGGTNTSGTTGTTTGGTTTGGPGQPNASGIPIKDYAGGPFIGVRPSKTGESFLEFRGVKSYEQWSFTALDLQAEIQAFNLGIQTSLQFK